MIRIEERYLKEGQLTGGTVAAIIGLIVGIGISVMVLVLMGAMSGQIYNTVEDDIDSLTATVQGESVTVYDNANATFANDDVVKETVTALNGSTVIGSGNWTIFEDEGYITLSADNPYNGSALDFNYTHGSDEIQESIRDGIIEAFTAFETTGSYLPLIVLAFVMVLILAMVLGMAGGFTGGGGGRTAL